MLGKKLKMREMESFVSKSRAGILLNNLSVLLFLLLPLGSATAAAVTGGGRVKYHNGPLLTGDVKVFLLWYGNFSEASTHVIKTFVQSLDGGAKSMSYGPQVSTWWKQVEQYQLVANNNLKQPPPIHLKLVREVVDHQYSLGKQFKKDSIPRLLQHQVVEKASSSSSSSAGKLTKNALALVFISDDVELDNNSCGQKCFQHGAFDDKRQLVYIIVKNPMQHCPWKCGWPFHPSDFSKLDLLVRPPNKNAGTDAMIEHLASALASTVTNPYGNGFYSDDDDDKSKTTTPLEIGDFCTKKFGSGSFPGYAGKILVDPSDGGAFNARGLNDTKFLIPGLWNPTDGRCWTLL